MDKKYWFPICLLLICILGIFLRIYHVEYPVLGYHGMKESHSLMEAYLMKHEGNWFVNRLAYTITPENPKGLHMDNLPILSWIVIPLWTLFGVCVTIARLIIIAFSVGCIIFIYLLTKELFEKENLALLASLLFAVCPLLIFFGRNFQYDVPALFFMLGTAYYYLKWRNHNKNKLLFGLFFILTCLIKLPFGIIIIPLILIPETHQMRSLKDAIFMISLIVPVALFRYYSSFVSSAHTMQGFILSEIPKMFTMDFWRAVYMYATIDNFTVFGLILAGIGLLYSIVQIKKWNYRFLVIWIFSYLIYAASHPVGQTGHNYYQIPYAPVIIILQALALILIINSVRNPLLNGIGWHQKWWGANFIKQGMFIFGILFVLMLWHPALKLSTTRQFDTQFVGLDVAGDYLLLNAGPTDMFMGSGHQSRGIAWHSRMRSMDYTTNVTKLKEYEDELNIQWVFLYRWGLDALNQKEISEYLQNNYQIAHMGALNNELVYILLKKGGTFNASNLYEGLVGKPIYHKEYEFTQGKVTMSFVDVIT